MPRDPQQELRTLKARAGNIKSRDIVSLAEASGWSYRNSRSGHAVYTKPGARRPLPVPQHAKALKKGTALALIHIIEEAL